MPARKQGAQLLGETAHADLAVLPVDFGQYRAERIHKHKGRAPGLYLGGYARQHLLKVALGQLGAQIDEMHAAAHLVECKKRKLLLVTQHLPGRLAQGGKKQRGLLGRGQGKHQLVR